MLAIRLCIQAPCLAITSGLGSPTPRAALHALLLLLKQPPEILLAPKMGGTVAVARRERMEGRQHGGMSSTVRGGGEGGAGIC
jgi:hypothetical protein